MRLPWCDTIPLAFLWLLAMFMFVTGVLFSAGDLTSAVLTDWLVTMRQLTLVLVLPLWACTRTIDFLCAGPLRRKARLIAAFPQGARSP